MRMRWRLALPIIGLTLFGAVTYHSVRMNRLGPSAPGRYFMWSAIRLDSDPLSRRVQLSNPCGSANEGCVGWDIRTIDSWPHPTWLERLFALSALPALVTASGITIGLGRLGTNEILSFMISMPLFSFAWFYFIGWLLDRRRYKRSS